MERKIPMRMCVVCRTMKDKRELLRIVKNGEEIRVDKTGKSNGRGAYVCKNPDCIAKLKKQKILNKVFSCSVQDEVYDSVIKEIDCEE